MELTVEGLAPQQTLTNVHAPDCRYSLPARVDVFTVAGELDPERCPRCRYLAKRLPKGRERVRQRRLAS